MSLNGQPLHVAHSQVRTSERWHFCPIACRTSKALASIASQTHAFAETTRSKGTQRPPASEEVEVSETDAERWVPMTRFH